jgi:N-acetylglutamate synthase-like GNAT family acetyltransferase
VKITNYRSEDNIQAVIRKAVKDIEPENYSKQQQKHLEKVIPRMNTRFAEKNRYTYFKAKENPEGIIGVAGFQNKTGTIAGIFTHPKHKKKGVGSKLLSRIEKQAKENGIHTIEAPASLEATGFYTKNGYTETGEKEQNIEGISIKLKTMEKTLKH